MDQPEWTLEELKMLQEAGVPMQVYNYAVNSIAYRPHPQARVYKTPEGAITVGHTREELLAAQEAGLKLQWWANGEWRRRDNTLRMCCTSLPYRLAPGQEWPPAAKPAFRVGQVWEMRNGRKATIDEITGDAVHPVRAIHEDGWYCGYTPDGRCIADDQEHPYDLIRLIEHAPAEPQQAQALDDVLRAALPAECPLHPGHAADAAEKPPKPLPVRAPAQFDPFPDLVGWDEKIGHDGQHGVVHTALPRFKGLDGQEGGRMAVRELPGRNGR